MLSCQDTTFLVVKKGQEKLGMWDKMRIFMHLSMCKYCNLFARQNKFIDEQVAKLDDTEINKLKPDVKEKILEDIHK